MSFFASGHFFATTAARYLVTSSPAAFASGVVALFTSALASRSPGPAVPWAKASEAASSSGRARAEERIRSVIGSVLADGASLGRFIAPQLRAAAREALRLAQARRPGAGGAGPLAGPPGGGAHPRAGGRLRRSGRPRRRIRESGRAAGPGLPRPPARR